MKRIFFATVVLLILLPTLLVGGRFGLFLLRSTAPDSAVTIVVPTGASFATVAEQLRETGVIASAPQFKLLARLRGDSHKIQAGEYLFTQPATPGKILDRLVSGDIVRLQLTVPEGYSLKEISSLLFRLEFNDAKSFLQLTRNRDFIHSLGIDAPTLEGYLFPETYTFGSRTSSRQLIAAMVRQFEKKTPPALLQEAKKHGLDRHKLVILASIIQKEAGNSAEMPLISAVFHNRLRMGMPLQADPTVIYGIPNFDGNLTRNHLLEPTPYNTYRMRGLPKGPITNPGADALRAAARPALVSYLYFVSRGDGTHYFSTTLAEHNAAVRRFQLKR
ncbi:MAG: endolytic transglycosylase MltG [Syntrophotaleaceae bacterium]